MAQTVKRPMNETSEELTPSKILDSLFTFRDISHKYHLNCMIVSTGSYAQHKALDGLYKGIQNFQDEIIEQLIGYIGSPINVGSILTIPSYRDTNDAIKLCKDIIGFASNLITYANLNNFHNISNIADELSGLAAETKYFLMFK